jgi:branched-chain amino acid transport system ATP-binding protein
VLRQVALTVAPGEVVAILGSNGAGKTTLMRTISGLKAAAAGRIRFEGREIGGRRASAIARSGLLHIPEGRGTIATMTVAENLRLADETIGAADHARRLGAVLARFPRLGERLQVRAGLLSGGEQQMLALGKAMIRRPRLLLLDEPSMGLSPRMVDEAYRALAELKAAGMTILLVEQSSTHALTLADRGYVLRQGRVVMEGAADTLRRDAGLADAYLGLAERESADTTTTTQERLT